MVAVLASEPPCPPASPRPAPTCPPSVTLPAPAAQHSGAANLGESLYWSSSQTGTCDAAARMWAAEAPQYAGSYSSATGHWNQVSNGAGKA